MRNYNALRAVLFEPWYMSDQSAGQLSFLVQSLLSPNMEFEPLSTEARTALAYTRSGVAGPSETSTSSNIGVISIRGALTKYDSMCSMGMESYASLVAAYDSNPNIDAIVLDIDSPGGSVGGTQELAEAIKATCKPTIGFVRDLAGSAGYWIVSACDEIIANNSTAVVGSIGVMCSWMDMKDYYSRQGIRPVSIYAPQSTDKNTESRQADSGDFSALKANLSVYADKFIAAVKQNRPAVTDDQLTGKTYFASEVIGSLVDSIGTFDQALYRAASFAKSELPIKNNKTMSTPLYPTLATTAGVESFESSDGSVSLTADQAAAAEAELATAAQVAANNATLQARNTALESQLATSTSSLAAANDTIATLNATIAAKPGASTAVVAPKTDPVADAFEEPLDFFAACKEAAKYL